jgi:uncharacterized protein YggE
MMSAHTRYVVIMVGLLTALAVGGAAGVALVPKAAALNSQRSAASVATLPAPASPAPMPATLAISGPTRTILVVGAGTATAVPDEATVGLGVSATRSDVRSAVNQANADMSRLLSALHKQGVLDKDIQTTSIAIYQQTNCCPSTVTGYSSSDQVTVTIHHLVNVNTVIEASIGAVGNDIQLNGINLTVANPTGTISAARSLAMADALARAVEWAKLAKHHVGSLLGLSEIVAATPTIVCGQACGSAGGFGGGGGGYQIQPGQTSFTVTITATYELLP